MTIHSDICIDSMSYGFKPDADVLILISQVSASVKVEAVDRVGVRAEVVLGAALWS